MNMNLAEPAPRVEAAIAADVAHEAPATAEMVQATEPAMAKPAPSVEPASEYMTPQVDTSKSSFKTSAASATAVRGSTGSDLECYAAILTGAPEKNFLKAILPCIYDERDFVTYGEVKKFMLVKAGTCFVYVDDTDPSPLYAIPLEDYVAVMERPEKPDKWSVTISPAPGTNQPREGLTTVLLKTRSTQKQAYQFTFDTKQYDSAIPKRFMDLVSQSQRIKGSGVVATVFHAGTDKTKV